MLLSALSFSLMSVVVKISASTVPTLQQVFCRNIIALVIVFFLMRRRKESFRVSKEYRWPLFFRAFFGYVGIITLFVATAGARQADIAILDRTSPIWVSLFAYLFLKEKISRVQIPVILLCMAGAAVAMRPAFDSDAMPLLLALATAVVCALAYTMIAFCKGHVSPLAVIFYFSLFSTVCGGIMMIPTYIPPSGRDWLMLLLLGLFGAGGQIGLTYAYQKAPASEVSIYDYSGIIFSALLGYFLLEEELTASTLLGAVLIVAGGAWSYMYNRKKPLQESEITK